MAELIIAIDRNGGIGKNGKLPWNISEELRLFKRKTLNSVVIGGRKTIESLPPLNKRIIYCISRVRDPRISERVSGMFSSIVNAIETAKTNYPSQKIFIIGGGEIYDHILHNYNYYLNKIHISYIKNSYDCDTFCKLNINELPFLIEHSEDYKDFTHVTYTRGTTDEVQYLNLLKTVANFGNERHGRNGLTKSLFARTIVFKLNEGFPLLTTKKMFFRAIVEELLFFIRGDTNSKLLEQKGINIWKGNTEREFLDKHSFPYEEGMMGPMYGWIWRFTGYEYDKDTGKYRGERRGGFDQLLNVIDLLKRDPYSRRIMMTTYNPDYAEQGVLYPCHSIVLQFYVEHNRLHLFCYNRSSDLFLGLPFNIASTSILFMLIAKITGYEVGELTLSLGDCHIYEGHLSIVREQLQRIPFKFPQLWINKELNNITDLENLRLEDFRLENYSSHSSLKADMIA